MCLNKSSDYEYIIEVIDIFRSDYNLNFFISPADFDILYRWWEKGVNLSIIRHSIENVVRRWRKRNRRINSVTNFSYEVRKNLKISRELNVNVNPEETKTESVEENIKNFLSDFPVNLEELKGDLREFISNRKRRNKTQLSKIYGRLIKLHCDDEELKIKKELFFRNISSSLKTVDLEKKYILNFLKRRYRFPDLDQLIRNDHE